MVIGREVMTEGENESNGFKGSPKTPVFKT